MGKTIKCSICKKPIAKMSQSFEKRMSLLREHRKKKHPAAFRKSVKKSMATRKVRK